MQRLTYSFGLDLRSLAFARMLLGALLLLDLGIRSTDLVTHYTDDGLLPRRALLTSFADPWHFSLHLVSGTALFQAVLFLGSAASAACFAVGYHARAASVICWVLNVSLQNRNPLVISGADVLLRLVLFWMMFLPVDARWSIDRLRNAARAPASDLFLSVGTAAYVAQIISVYVFAGLIKLDVPAWLAGEGLAYALRVPAFETAFGIALSDHPELLRRAGLVIPYFEIAFPLLLLAPTRSMVPRALCVLSFVAFHAGIGLSLSIGIFSLVGCVAWSVFLPSWTWDRLAPALARRFGVVRNAASRARAIGSGIAARLPSVGSEVRSANDRWRRLRASSATAFCAAMALYVLAWNVVGLPERPTSELPSSIRWLGPLLRVDQRWNMFSRPITSGGWFVAQARLKSGKKWELLADRPVVNWDRPKVVSATFRNDRWRKYLVNLTVPHYDWARREFGYWMCVTWNDAHDLSDPLEAFSLYLMEEPLTPWDPPVTLRQVPLLEYECKPGLLKKWQGKI